MRGVTVTVLRPSKLTRDRFNNDVPGKPTPEEVAGVLVSPRANSDMEASRPDGVTVALTLHFPKSYTASLRGCGVMLPAPWSGTYRVIGDPKPYMDENTPGRWNRPVEVEASDG